MTMNDDYEDNVTRGLDLIGKVLLLTVAGLLSCIVLAYIGTFVNGLTP